CELSAAIDEFPLQPAMVKARGEVGVLSAPALEGFVVAVDGDQVVAPDAQIATEDAVQLAAPLDDWARPAYRLELAPEPTGGEQHAQRGLARQQLGHEVHRHEATPALHEAPAFGQSPVIPDKALERQAIAIDENEV